MPTSRPRQGPRRPSTAWPVMTEPHSPARSPLAHSWQWPSSSPFSPGGWHRGWHGQRYSLVHVFWPPVTRLRSLSVLSHWQASTLASAPPVLSRPPSYPALVPAAPPPFIALSSFLSIRYTRSAN